MRRHPSSTVFLLSVAFASVLTACAGVSATTGFPQSAPIRAATDTPARFDIASVGGGAAAADGTCQSPIRDPRTGLELRFVRAVPGLGDYAVPEGAYGARAGELLRIDCRTWQAVGLVLRRAPGR
jgi:hypothetical protein